MIKLRWVGIKSTYLHKMGEWAQGKWICAKKKERYGRELKLGMFGPIHKATIETRPKDGRLQVLLLQITYPRSCHAHVIRA